MPIRWDYTFPEASGTETAISLFVIVLCRYQLNGSKWTFPMFLALRFASSCSFFKYKTGENQVCTALESNKRSFLSLTSARGRSISFWWKTSIRLSRLFSCIDFCFNCINIYFWSSLSFSSSLCICANKKSLKKEIKLSRNHSGIISALNGLFIGLFRMGKKKHISDRSALSKTEQSVTTTSQHVIE